MDKIMIRPAFIWLTASSCNAVRVSREQNAKRAETHSSYTARKLDRSGKCRVALVLHHVRVLQIRNVIILGLRFL